MTSKMLLGVLAYATATAAPTFNKDIAPILNNRIVNTRQVTGTIRDVSGQGGTYILSTANNRYFDRPGISASVSPSTVPRYQL